MRFTSIIVVAFVATTAVAIPAKAVRSSPHVLHERREEPHPKWLKRGRMHPKATLPMRIGMTQRNLHRAEELLMEVSAHDSPRFGQHYTAEEIIDLFAPAQDTVDITREWLESAGIEAHRIGHSANKQWIQFDADAEEAERLFKTEYHLFEHVANGKTHVACDEYHLPEHVRPHVDYITPGLRLISTGQSGPGENIKKRDLHKLSKRLNYPGPILGPVVTLPDDLSKANLLKLCDSFITPPCIKEMYNITEGTLKHPDNQLGIFEEGDYYAAEDLVLFFTTFADNILPTTEPTLHGIDGGAPLEVATGESDLDFQISYPIITPQQAILFQTDDVNYALGLEDSGGFLNTFFDAIDGSYCTSCAFGECGDANIDPKYPDPMATGYQGKLQCGVYKPTHVISISYGEQEDDLPTNYQRRQCAEVMKLGMQGVTVVLASGDSGVAARSTDDGNSNGCLGSAGTVFNPDFPASCPYISALGATFLPSGAEAKGDNEVAVTSFPSGGGFSNIYTRPSWQDKAVTTYFETAHPDYAFYQLDQPTNNPVNLTHGGRYNRIGRGYPDFSAVGDNVLIFLDGTPQLIGGTSAAAPVFAAILNRINEERLSAGKSTVGFVNPTLYAHPEVFHDIVTGSNPGCNTTGFHCAKGWDPVTGLGTPNYQKMLELYMSLP